MSGKKKINRKFKEPRRKLKGDATTIEEKEKLKKVKKISSDQGQPKKSLLSTRVVEPEPEPEPEP
jgi:hypothetical protein